MTPQRREILNLRSERDKFAIAIAGRTQDVNDEITRMTAEGLIVWLDRAVVSELAIPADVYLLTPKGVALCDAEGIKRH